MFKLKLALLIVGLLITSTSVLCKPTYSFLKDRTVYIKGVHTVSTSETGKKTRGTWVGTGIVYTVKDNYTYILTNAHVAGKNHVDVSLYVESYLGFVGATVVQLYSGADLAMMKVQGTLGRKQPIGLVRMNVNVQEPVYVVGHHLGRPYVYGEGVVAGRDKSSNALIVQVPCAFGNSGSGVFDEKGNLVGVVFAISRIGPFGVDVAHALAVNGISVILFIESIPELAGTLNYK